MKLIKENYNQPTVGEIRRILQQAIHALSDYDESAPVKIENNTYYITGKTFLGITSVGYVDFDHMVEESSDSEDFED